MALKALNCPNCGGKIETFDDSMAKGICPFCDSIIKDVKEEQKKYIKSADAVNLVIDYSDNIDSYLTMAENAFKAENYDEAESYANKVIEIESNNSKAWFIKGNSAGWLTKANNNRILEALTCWENSLKYSENRLAEDVKKALLVLFKTMTSLYCERFATTVAITEKDKAIYEISNSINQINKFSNNTKLDITEVIDEIGRNVTLTINHFVVQAFETISRDYGYEPAQKTKINWDRFVQRADLCIDMLVFAVNQNHDDYENKYGVYKNIIDLEKKVIDSCAFVYDSSDGKYKISYHFTDAAVKNRKNMIKQWSREAEEFDPKIRKKREEEAARKERYEKYWVEHSEERAKLEDRLKELEDSIKAGGLKARFSFNKDCRDVRSEIRDIKNELSKDR